LKFEIEYDSVATCSQRTQAMTIRKNWRYQSLEPA